MVASGPSRGWRECDGEEESGVDGGVGLSHLVTFVASDPSLPFDLSKDSLALLHASLWKFIPTPRHRSKYLLKDRRPIFM